jgi:hypothetical protein
MEGKHMFWFWLNVPLMLVFFGLWAGVPLWHTLHSWDAELKAKQAALGIGVIPAPVSAPPAPTTPAAEEAGQLTYA